MTTSSVPAIDEVMYLSLRHHGVLQDIQQRHLCAKKKQILFACGNGGAIGKVIAFNLKLQGVELDESNVHPMPPTAGPLVLCEDYPLAKSFPGLSEYWLNEIKYVIDKLGHYVILLHGHRPCAREADFNHDLFETVKRLFQAKDTVRLFVNRTYAENPEILAEIKIIPLFDMLRPEGIRTYFANRAKWTEFAEAGKCELVAGVSSHF